MIKIETNQIEKWDIIKKKHLNWGQNFISSRIIEIKAALEGKSSKKIKKELEFYSKIENIIEKIVIGENLNEDVIKNIERDYTSLKNNLKRTKFYSDICDVVKNVINNEKTMKNENELKKTLKKLKKFFCDNGKDSYMGLSTIKKDFFTGKFKIKKELETDRKNLKRELEKLKKCHSSFDERIKYIFDYENTFGKKDWENGKLWGRHRLLSMMDVRVCPYCQRNYITSYLDTGKRKSKDKDMLKTTGDLDHFYSQGEFPYLALSLYNFIPSCQICNSRFKISRSSKKILYPYKEGFDGKEFQVKFSTNKKSVGAILNDEDLLVELKPIIKLSVDNQKRIDETIKIFGLNEVYKSSHSGYIKDLLYNLERYPEDKIKEIAKDIFGKNSDYLSIEIYLKELIKKPYKDRIENKEPLAKLTKDILDEFKIELDL